MNPLIVGLGRRSGNWIPPLPVHSKDYFSSRTFSGYIRFIHRYPNCDEVSRCHVLSPAPYRRYHTRPVRPWTCPSLIDNFRVVARRDTQRSRAFGTLVSKAKYPEGRGVVGFYGPRIFASRLASPSLLTKTVGVSVYATQSQLYASSSKGSTTNSPSKSKSSQGEKHRTADNIGDGMPPISEAERELDKNKAQLLKWIKDDTYPVIIFSKTTCPYCKKVKELFEKLSVKYTTVELDTLENGAVLQNALTSLTGQKTVPNVFILGQHIGGSDTTQKLQDEGKLLLLVQGKISSNSPVFNLPLTPSPPNIRNSSTNTSPVHTNGEEKKNYDYDLVVIGGGSGGLAASKEAARLGAKVAVFDYVVPTPLGTSWGLGGTCVNVGCIPKKLMHQASLLGEAQEDALKFGWEIPPGAKHNWETMVTNVQDYISSLNWKYKLALRDVSVTYLNAYARFEDAHKVIAVNNKNKESSLTSDKFIIATGGRPRYPNIPGAKEYCVTSDDIFSLPYPPGKTLVVGASYVALECAGFLKTLGYDVTVMVRSILLRGFDQDMANRIGDYMEKQKSIKFIREAIPTKIEQIEDGTPRRLRVTSDQNGEEIVDEYNTVLLAIGRDACTSSIGLDKVGVKVNASTGKLEVKHEQTNVKNIYAIGDVLDGHPELTPVAIKAGILLAKRLFGGSKETYDYNMIATTVFTPLEYGAIGYAEEAALEKFGKDNIETYHTNYRPLEWAVPARAENVCYAKLICNKQDDERVVGFHVLGPNAGEITQGWALGMRLGAKKKDFDATTGIHPTCAEVFTTMNITRSSGKDISAAAC